MEKKTKERNKTEIKVLTNRIHRIVGQLHGIESMIEENRYCKDVLIQIAAVEKAVQSLGYMILHDHLESCVREKVKKDDSEVMFEVMDLVKKLKG